MPTDYRGATVEDLQLSPALVLPASATVSNALRLAFEREYDIIPITDAHSRRLFGWAQIANLRQSVDQGSLSPDATLEQASASTPNQQSPIRKFPKRASYKIIEPSTPLADLEAFFEEQKTFALITDSQRKFVLGVCTPEDLQKFVKRRNPNNA